MTALHGSRRDHSRDRARIFQIEFSLDLARQPRHPWASASARNSSPTWPVPPRRRKRIRHALFLDRPRRRAGVVRGQQRLPPGAILEVPFHRRERGPPRKSASATSRARALSLVKSIA